MNTYLVAFNNVVDKSNSIDKIAEVMDFRIIYAETKDDAIRQVVSTDKSMEGYIFPLDTAYYFKSEVIKTTSVVVLAVNSEKVNQEE